MLSRDEKSTKIFTVILAIVCLLIIFSIVFSIISWANNYRKTVGYIEGNTLYFDNKIYVESYDISEININVYLGKIECVDNGYLYKIYSIENQPEYIYLSLGFIGRDQRIYKAIN